MLTGRQKGIIRQETGPSFVKLLVIFSQFSIPITEEVVGGMLDNSNKCNLLHFLLHKY